MEMHEQDIENLVSIIAEGHPKPILLLGAGASVKSGIPTTATFVERAAAWSYARRKQISFEDVRIRRSDWLPFLENQKWFNSSKSLSENYPNVFKHLLAPRETRRDFFRLILNPKVEPSHGYQALRELVAKKYFNTILTTNFDNILYKVFSSDERLHIIDVIKSISDYSKISSDPKYVQIIHLHGDVDNYTDKNDIEEIQSLNDQFIKRIVPLLSDHPIIVVGYRGYENSIMKTLFLDNSSYATNYKHGIYWCILESENLDEMPENLKALQAEIGTNLQFIKIKGFDHLFEIDILKGIKPTYKISKPASSQSPDSIFDLNVVQNASLSNFDQILLKQRILQYCKTLLINLPNELTDDALIDVLKERDLLAEKDGNLSPTNSGLLLFGKNPSDFLPNTTIKVVINDYDDFFKNNFLSEEEEFRTEYIIKGNLWNQLNEIIDIISIFNKQFKLKSEQSSTVTPYPPLAIKELLTNCIVHRDYENSIQTQIEIYPRFIKIVNSGGLVEDVQDKLEGEQIEDVIKKGSRGIKGYRNPVLADLFYGTETMEKRGSGLADVFEEIMKYASQVKFGPIDNNKCFEAIIYARPELVDEITKTAKQKIEYLQKFSTNIIEIISPPKHIYIAEIISSVMEIHENQIFEIPPPFVLWNNKMVSFLDISNSQYGLSKYIDKGTLEKYSVEEFSSNYDSERQYIDLLNQAILAHIRYLGLNVDGIKRRAFFTKNTSNEDNVTIRYQARVKSATRTIVKKRVSSTTGKIVYWEHKSFSFKIEKFKTSLGIILIPNYSFTVDGFSKYIKTDKINILSTKRASRDYNINYLNDLNFWIWIMTKGGIANSSLQFLPPEIMIKVNQDEQVVIANELIKATTLSEELFNDMEYDDYFEDANDIYDEVDKIAFEPLSDENNFPDPDENSEGVADEF